MTTFAEPALEEMPLSGGEDTIYWLRKRHHRDHEDQETIMGYIINLQVTVRRGGRDEKI